MLFCNASYLCQKAPPFEHLIRAAPLVGRTAPPLHNNSFLFLDLFADWDRQEWHTFELLQAKLSHHKIHGQSLARKGATEHGELALSQTLAMFDVYSAEGWNLPQSSKDENQNKQKRKQTTRYFALQKHFRLLMSRTRGCIGRHFVVVVTFCGV